MRGGAGGRLLRSGPRRDAALRRGAGARTKKIVPMSHFDFIEKIAEGFVIEAYNSTKTEVGNKINLHAYTDKQLQRALEEMRGAEPPSKAATGVSGGPDAGNAHATGLKGGKAVKRSLITKVAAIPARADPFAGRLITTLLASRGADGARRHAEREVPGSLWARAHREGGRRRPRVPR